MSAFRVFEMIRERTQLVRELGLILQLFHGNSLSSFGNNPCKDESAIPLQPIFGKEKRHEMLDAKPSDRPAGNHSGGQQPIGLRTSSK
jgi:hypothetical protein